MDLLREHRLHILDHLGAEEIAEEIAHEVSGQLHLLIRIGVPIVVGNPAREHIQNLLGYR